VGDIVRQHWRAYGRNYYTRYDYEQVDAAKAGEMVEALLSYAAAFAAEGFGPDNPKPLTHGFALATADEFSYTDPIDGSVSSRQGVRLLFADGSRVIFRLSGTGSVGATVRMYIEKYQPAGDEGALGMDTADALQPLVDLALELARVVEFTGRDAPTVIT